MSDARPNHDALLMAIGTRVRRLRSERRMTAAEVASEAGLSLRFYRDLENGRANIAVGRLAQVADALGVGMDRLVVESTFHNPRLRAVERRLQRLPAAERDAALSAIERAVRQPAPAGAPKPADVIALWGLRGAGKSTIGPLLATRLGVEFVELDGRIEDAAGLGLAEIFALHGEAYYRRLETRCLIDILGELEPAVVALSGGIVHNPPAFELASRQCRTVWLRAEPEDHMARVIDQGDFRPMEDREDAMSELRALLSSREPLYQQADITVNTSEVAIDAAVTEIAAAFRLVSP